MALHVDITVRKMFVLCYKFVQRDYEVFVRFSEINQSTQIPTSHLLYETLGPIYEQKSKSPTSCGKVRQTLIFFWQCMPRFHLQNAACRSHYLHSKELHKSPLYGAKLTPGLVQMLAAY